MLVATVCASPPESRARWTLELLAGAMVKLTEHKGLSHETVRRRLAENGLRIDDPKRLHCQITAWERRRNAARSGIKWMFTTDKARAEMGRAYPATFQRVIITVQSH